MAGIVDVARGPVGDRVPTSDAIPLPEGLLTGQDHLGGTGVMHQAECFPLILGEWWLKGDEACGLG